MLYKNRVERIDKLIESILIWNLIQISILIQISPIINRNEEYKYCDDLQKSRSLCVTFDWNLCLFLLRNCFTFFQLYNNQARKMRAKSSGQTKTNTNRDIWQLCVHVCVAIVKRKTQNKTKNTVKENNLMPTNCANCCFCVAFLFLSFYFIYISAHLLLMLLLLLSSCAITTTSQICNNKKKQTTVTATNGSEVQHLATPLNQQTWHHFFCALTKMQSNEGRGARRERHREQERARPKESHVLSLSGALLAVYNMSSIDGDGGSRQWRQRGQREQREQREQK